MCSDVIISIESYPAGLLIPKKTREDYFEVSYLYHTVSSYSIQDRGWVRKYFKRNQSWPTWSDRTHGTSGCTVFQPRFEPIASRTRTYGVTTTLTRDYTPQTPALIWAEPRRVKWSTTSGSVGITPPCLNSALDGGAWSVSRPSRFTPGERTAITSSIGKTF
jgi:hypothetical protein